ncbi:MAG: Crp/Fnr family transcriptional regulator [Saprospiraceae bacterium]|nr:Crp/Fnr family transcriptional regulator [Saprospiraceae bacterium]
MDDRLLRKIAGIMQVSDQKANLFVERGKSLLLPKKTELAAPGKTVNQSFFVIEGCVRHFVRDKQRKEFTKNFLQGPKFMVPSITSFFMQRPSEIYCETLTELKVITWSYRDLMQFAEQHPGTYSFLLKAVVRAFYLKEEKEIEMNRLSASERYQVFLKRHPGLINQVPSRFVASYLNIRPETLSRIRAARIS